MKNYLNKHWPLLFFPFLVIPVFILIFYILGGGSAPANEKKEAEAANGKVAVNYHLPEADRSIGIVDKMEAVQAQSQSFGTQDYHITADELSSDPTAAGTDSTSEQEDKENQASTTDVRSDPGIPDTLMVHIRRQEVQVKQELRNAAGDTSVSSKAEIVNTTVHAGSADNNGLPTGPKTLNDPSGHPSTGIKEMDELFDRSLALARQNDSLNFSLQQANLREQQRAAEETGHYSLEKDRNKSGSPEKKTDFAGSSVAIPAEIFETATVLTGNRVKIRLLGDTRLNGRKIPRNTFVYGICRTENERLQIDVQQLQVEGQFIPVKMTVCDLDGLPGLYVPDNAARKITKEVGSGANTSSMVGFTGNPLAYAGVQAADRAARSALQVIKQKKVTIRKNTLVYLMNKNK